MTAGTVATAVQEGQVLADQMLQIVQVEDPNAALTIDKVEKVVDLAAQYVAVALNAWSAASGIPITTDSITALLPNSTPLSAPDPAK